MFTEWLGLTVFIIFLIYMVTKNFFYMSIAEKEEKKSTVMKLTLQEAEVLIRKHQLQLQRALGNIDILTDELTNIRNELKAIKQRNSQYRVESEKYRAKIRDLEQKIEALL